MKNKPCGAAPLEQPVRQIFCVAVWWPRDGEYGGITNFDTEIEARRHRDWLLSPSMGYKDVHIWKKTVGREIIAA